MTSITAYLYTLYLVNVLLYAFMHPFSFLCVLYYRMYNFSPRVVSWGPSGRPKELEQKSCGPHWQDGEGGCTDNFCHVDVLSRVHGNLTEPCEF